MSSISSVPFVRVALMLAAAFGSVFLFNSTMLLAQQLDDGSVQPLLLQHADSLVGKASPQGLVRELIGNVSLTQGAVNIACDRAIHYMQQNRADLVGNVVLTQGTVTMKAPRGSYDGNSRLIYGVQGVFLQDRSTVLTAHEGYYSTATKIARFYKTVRIDTDSLLIIADTLEYVRASQDSYCTGNVTAAGKYTSALLQGDSLVNIPAQHYTRVACYKTKDGLRQPLVSQIDTLTTDERDSARTSAIARKKVTLDTLCITGDVLEAFRGDSANPKRETYLATGNVKLTRGSTANPRNSLAARAGTGIYEKMLDRIWMLQTPVLWLDSTQLRGDTILINIREKRLERVTATGSAFAASKNDTTRQDRIDQLTGETIVISMARDTLRSIVAENKAFNLYFLTTEEDGKKRADGAAKNAADTIKIQFAGGEPDQVIWLGKVEGEHIPERIVKKTLAELKLKNFQWLENRPRLRRGTLGEILTPASTTTNKTPRSNKSAPKQSPPKQKKSKNVR